MQSRRKVEVKYRQNSCLEVNNQYYKAILVEANSYFYFFARKFAFLSSKKSPIIEKSDSLSNLLLHGGCVERLARASVDDDDFLHVAINLR